MKKRLILSLKIRAADHQHSRGEESVLPDEPLFTVDALLSTKHRPLVCAERYWRLRHRPVIQTEEPAGCVVTPAGLQLLLTPEGKTHQRIWWLKAATWECLCVWTLVNRLQYLFSTPFACCDAFLTGLFYQSSIFPSSRFSGFLFRVEFQCVTFSTFFFKKRQLQLKKKMSYDKPNFINRKNTKDFSFLTPGSQSEQHFTKVHVVFFQKINAI